MRQFCFSIAATIVLSAGIWPLTLPRAYAQSAGDTAETVILRVQLDSPAKVKLGAAIHARTVDPLYRGNVLVLPARTAVTGMIVEVDRAPREKRLDAISHGDFTPLREARLQFNSVVLANGVSLPIEVAPAAQSADVLRFQSSTHKSQSLLHQAWAGLGDRKNQAVGMITSPGKMDRLKKALFAQLPWHPQAIEGGTQYDVTLQRPIVLPAPVPSVAPAVVDTAVPTSGNGSPPKQASYLHARLQNDLSSKSAKRDDVVTAEVTQPVLDKQGKIQIPQGATLRGRVLQARAAKKWGKNGALRFTFNQVDFPQGGGQQQVAGVPAAVDGSKSGSLKLDAEGGVQPDTNKGIMLPLVLGWLAASSIFDEDAGVAKIGVTSNGFGLLTRVIAISTGSRYVGAAIGSVATVRTIYTRFLAHGRDVNFARNSQIEVELGPMHPIAHPAIQP